MDQMEVKSEELLALIRPTISSKTARKNILNALTEILEKEYNSKVFVYGSFPLSTYLPCGDIDVSMAARPALPRSIVVSVGAFLGSYNDKNPGAPISIKVINVIEPESAGGVSLVKCLVENVPVDISINTLGGVCSLAFLEEADLKIGMSHLLKKSVILIKAWLKYENEPTILKSSEGLLSTYALEVMILYIINRFSTEVKTPLKCLQKFLEYFSNFDWKKHILTISGPILKGSNMPVERSANLLLGQEFLGKCYKQYSFLVSSGLFNEKEISIVDLVDPCNNIGKSVKKNLEFIRGLVDGYSKFNSIVVSSDMLMPFPTLTAKFSGSNSSQLSDLKGDLNQMIKCVEEARELHSLIKRAHQKPHHLSHDSTPLLQTN